MTKTLKMLLAAALVVSGAFASAGVARAANVSNSSGDNVQSGSNRSTSNQTGNSKTGAAVGGQVTGVVSSGATSVDARNTSTNTDVTSGDSRGSNTARNFTGLNDAPTTTVGGAAADVSGVGFADNLQDGNNRSSLSQSSTATSGDGVAGQVIGIVTSGGGSTSAVAANTTRDSSIQTGDARSDNSVAAFVGLNTSEGTGAGGLSVGDVLNSCTSDPCNNVQSGNNTLTGNQTSHAKTGDGVGGQVIGAVSAGRTSIDASNTTDNSDVTTGNADSANHGGEFVGLNDSPTTTVLPADVTGVTASNVQDGANRRTLTQTSDATSGDAVAGQVSGVVTSAGGSASVVLANTSTNIDATSGDGRFNNNDSGFSGLNTSSGPLFVGDLATPGPVA